MPKTKTESLFFTAVTAWLMVYMMTLYNHVLASGTFSGQTMLTALKGMWSEYLIIFVLAYFVSGRLSKSVAFTFVKNIDKPIVIILTIQFFMVILQVAFASIIGVYHRHGFTMNIITDYLTTYGRNFIMALPLQVILVGPAARYIFRVIFRRESEHAVEEAAA